MFPIIDITFVNDAIQIFASQAEAAAFVAEWDIDGVSIVPFSTGFAIQQSTGGFVSGAWSFGP